MGLSWSSRRGKIRNHHVLPLHRQQSSLPPNPTIQLLPPIPHPVPHNHVLTIPQPPRNRPNRPPFIPYLENVKKIQKEVRILKDSIRVEVDEKNLDFHLVSFTFDAGADGSLTILNFAKEGANCTFTPTHPEIYKPVKVPFQRGLGQKFCQPSEAGNNLGLFDPENLSKPSPNEDIFPLIIIAETCLPSQQMDEQLGEALPTQVQILQAVLEKNNDDHFQVRVVKQILQARGICFKARFDDNEEQYECVVCKVTQRDTAALPCRHYLMCSICAKTLIQRGDNCPFCRGFMEQLLQINFDEALPEAGVLAG